MKLYENNRELDGFICCFTNILPGFVFYICKYVQIISQSNYFMKWKLLKNCRKRISLSWQPIQVAIETKKKQLFLSLYVNVWRRAANWSWAALGGAEASEVRISYFFAKVYVRSNVVFLAFVTFGNIFVRIIKLGIKWPRFLKFTFG